MVVDRTVKKSLCYFEYISKISPSKNLCTLPKVVLFNLFIDKINEIILNLDKKIDRSKTNEILLLAFEAGKEKILKHNKCHWMYCISLILDPLHKVTAFDNSL